MQFTCFNSMLAQMLEQATLLLVSDFLLQACTATLSHKQFQTSAQLSNLDCTREPSGAKSCLGNIYKLASKAQKGQAQ